jgi:hypothetical protein
MSPGISSNFYPGSLTGRRIRTSNDACGWAFTSPCWLWPPTCRSEIQHPALVARPDAGNEVIDHRLRIRESEAVVVAGGPAIQIPIKLNRVKHASILSGESEATENMMALGIQRRASRMFELKPAALGRRAVGPTHLAHLLRRLRSHADSARN